MSASAKCIKGRVRTRSCRGRPKVRTRSLGVRVVSAQGAHKVRIRFLRVPIRSAQGPSESAQGLSVRSAQSPFEVKQVPDTGYQVPGTSFSSRTQNFILQNEILVLCSTRYQVPGTSFSSRTQNLILQNKILVLCSTRYQEPGTSYIFICLSCLLSYSALGQTSATPVARNRGVKFQHWNRAVEEGTRDGSR